VARGGQKSGTDYQGARSQVKAAYLAGLREARIVSFLISEIIEERGFDSTASRGDILVNLSYRESSTPFSVDREVSSLKVTKSRKREEGSSIEKFPDVEIMVETVQQRCGHVAASRFLIFSSWTPSDRIECVTDGISEFKPEIGQRTIKCPQACPSSGCEIRKLRTTTF